ncbi:MAG TPA: hypothetical protein VFF50_07475 [Candidatus Deferrimicrobiaceae bacterium]|jgi:hypothetical protein|nr:hypothetical protein [Candidatus Deferrimicrobiaceae bacterium]
MSASMPCSPQKSSICWVSRMPLMPDPAGERLIIKLNEAIGLGFSRASTSVMGAVQLNQLQVRIDVVFAGDPVEDEVEGVGVLLHGGIFEMTTSSAPRRLPQSSP